MSLRVTELCTCLIEPVSTQPPSCRQVDIRELSFGNGHLSTRGCRYDDRVARAVVNCVNRQTVAGMTPVYSSIFQTPVVTGCHAAEPLRPFTYGWKRLARTWGMQQTHERRSANPGCKLSVRTLAVLERPPPASLARNRVPSQRSQSATRRQALLQESLLETTPSQTNADGRLTVAISFKAFASCKFRWFHYRWFVLLTSLVQLGQYHAWCWHAVYSICFKRGELKQSFLAVLASFQQTSLRLCMRLTYVHASQGGWATLGVLGLLWICTNYTGKV